MTEAQQWEAYEKSRSVPWHVFAHWLSEEYGISTSRSAIYRWQKHMRAQAGTHRLECAITARSELRSLAQAGDLAAEVADAYMALANNAILEGDPDRAAKIVSAAVAIHAESLKRTAQAQQAEKLALQKDELALKREKFEAQERRLAQATATAQDETLSESERLAKIKAIFGV